jgi:hypothetical protein
MSGGLDSLRIPSRSSFARAMGREEKASNFCVMRERRDGNRLGVHLDIEDTGQP